MRVSLYLESILKGWGGPKKGDLRRRLYLKKFLKG